MKHGAQWTDRLRGRILEAGLTTKRGDCLYGGLMGRPGDGLCENPLSLPEEEQPE